MGFAAALDGTGVLLGCRECPLHLQYPATCHDPLSTANLRHLAVAYSVLVILDT